VPALASDGGRPTRRERSASARGGGGALHYISQARLFDESKSKIIAGSDANGEDPRHTLTVLDGRSGNDFHITSAKKFFFALGFVLNNLVVESNDSMNVKFLVEGLSKDGGKPAWEEPGEHNYKNRWKEFDIAKSLGADAVLQAFNLKEGQGFPIAVIIECKKWEELSHWSGEIRITVQDLNVSEEAHQTYLRYKVDIDEPKLSSNGSASCNE
jgi:hypothetical protein